MTSSGRPRVLVPFIITGGFFAAMVLLFHAGTSRWESSAKLALAFTAELFVFAFVIATLVGVPIAAIRISARQQAQFRDTLLAPAAMGTTAVVAVLVVEMPIVFAMRIASSRCQIVGLVLWIVLRVWPFVADIGLRWRIRRHARACATLPLVPFADCADVIDFGSGDQLHAALHPNVTYREHRAQIRVYRGDPSQALAALACLTQERAIISVITGIPTVGTLITLFG